jgi:succinoglycan biosynthesis transport protein ExoP
MKDEEIASILAESGPKAPQADWREYYHAIRERLWLVLLCFALGGIGAGIYLSRQEVRYQARAVLFIEIEQNRVLKDVKTVSEDRIGSVDMINTVVDLLRGYPFAQRVATSMKLHEDKRFLEAIPGADGLNVTPAEAASALVGMISAQYRKNTRLIDVFATHRDPAVATRLANGCAEEYLRYIFENRSDANKGASQFLLDESHRLRKKMRVADEALQTFRERERAASLENVQENAQGKLTDMSRRMTEIEQRIFQLDTDLKVAQAAPSNTEELLRLPSVSSEPKVARINDAIADQERQILLINQRYRAKHPIYMAAQTQLRSLMSERDAVLRDVVSLLETNRQHLESLLGDVKKASSEQETKLLSVTGKTVEYNDLKRELETDQAMYESVLARIKEIDLTKGLTDLPVRIHERAGGAAPIRVSIIKVFGAGIFLGLALGFGLALALHALDQSIKTVEQAEHITGLPVLAAIAARKGSGGSSKTRTLDSVTNRNGPIAESFRSLRASIAMLGDAEARRSFLFTSAIPSEGKTFCSTNFAVTLGQQGFRTLIIDADLRKPMVSNVLFHEHRKPGLTEILSGQTTLADAIFPSEIENLFVLTTGSRAPNPAELLATPRLREVLEQAEGLFDRVVIDTAPMLAVSDTLLIAPLADVVCLVLRSFRTPQKTAARAVKALTDIQCRPAGIVLNFVPSGAGSYYYYSGKYYGSYGAKGVYGAK